MNNYNWLQQKLHLFALSSQFMREITFDFESSYMPSESKTENHIFIGLYHKYGRKPFLEEFKSVDNEDKMFERYCELDSRFTDETHLRSWFRDQVLHPHETTHTMEEVNEILYENNMELIWSSIEGDEKLYEDLTRAKLSNNEYWPGFFTFLARRI